MRAKGPYAWKRFVLPAFSLFWLILIWISLFHPAIYRPPMVVTAYGLNAVVVVSASPELERAGLYPGTVIDGLSYAKQTHLRGTTQRGLVFAIPVHSGNTVHIVTTRADTPFTYESTAETWFAFVTLTFALVLTAYLGYRRPGVMIAALILFIAGGGLDWPSLAAALSSLPDAAFAALMMPTHLLASIFPTLALASFAIRLPNDDADPRKRNAIRAIDAIVILGLFAEAFYRTRSQGVLYLGISAIVVIVACMLSLRYARPSDRGRVGIVFAAVILGGAGYAVAIMVESYTGPTVQFYAYSGLSVIIVPVSLAYAILRHRVFDIAFVLNRTLVYALTSAFILVILAALEFVAERYVNALTHVEGVLVEFFIALIVIVSARLIHRKIDQLVDAIFFRTRHQQESALRRFSTAAQFYTAQDPLVRDTVDALVRFGRVQGAAVYLSTGSQMECAASTFESPAAPRIDENDSAYVALRAHRDELDTHDFKTAFSGARLYPMVLAGRLAGTIATGERESGEAIPPDIDDAIKRVVSAVTIALAAIESDRIRQENAVLQQRLDGIQAV